MCLSSSGLSASGKKILYNLYDVFHAEKENSMTLIACVGGVCLLHLLKMMITIRLLWAEPFLYAQDMGSQVKSWLHQTREFCFLWVLFFRRRDFIWMLCSKAKIGERGIDDWPSGTFSHLHSQRDYCVLGDSSCQDSPLQIAHFALAASSGKSPGSSSISKWWIPLCLREPSVQRWFCRRPWHLLERGVSLPSQQKWPLVNSNHRKVATYNSKDFTACESFVNGSCFGSSL